MSGFEKWFLFGRSPLFDLALRSQEQGLLADAAVAYEAFLEETGMDPGMRRVAQNRLADCHRKMADEDYDRGDHEGVLFHLQRAVALHPDFADVRFRLARAYARGGAPELALAEVENALRLNPRYVTALLLRAWILYRMERCDEAMVGLIDAVEAQPAIDDERYQEFVLLHNAGKNDRAAEMLRELAEVDSNAVKAILTDADVAFRTSRFEVAVTLYARVLELEPGYADVHCRQGQSLLGADRVQEGLAHLDQALAINPLYADAHAHRGLALRRLGRGPEAREAFRSALQLVPDHVVATSELDRLMGVP